MVLDQVLTVAIGRNGSDGKPMSWYKWNQFQGRVKDVLEIDGTVVAHTTGGGVGSDGVNEGESEESAVFVVINTKWTERTRMWLASIIGDYGQSSACFALDKAHEPVFPTVTGYREGI